jgi:hypothetical protein
MQEYQHKGNAEYDEHDQSFQMPEVACTVRKQRIIPEEQKQAYSQE